MNSESPQRRSKACHKCRTARVKCGDERPSCRRCAQNGYTCEYPDPLELNFRNENDKAAIRAVSLWRQRSSAYTEERNFPSKIESSRVNTSQFPQKASRNEPSTDGLPCDSLGDTIHDVSGDIRDIAVTRFFRDFGCTSQITTPWLDFFRMLPKFYNHPSSIDSPIVHIILAVALAYFSRKKSYPEVEILARTQYCEAIGKINAHFNRQGQASTNELIAAISLMGFFESLMPDLAVEDRDQRVKVFTHLSGAIAIIQKFESQASDSPDFDLRVLNLIYFQTVIVCLRKRIPPPLPIRMWTVRAHNHNRQYPGGTILRLMYQISTWQADMDAVLMASNRGVDPSHTKAQILKTLARMHDADTFVLQWESSLPPHFMFHSRDWNDQGDKYPLSRNHYLLSFPGAPRDIYIFQSCWATLPRVLAFIVRAILHQNVVHCCACLAQLDSQGEEWSLQSNISRGVIIDMVENICRCVNSLLMDSFFAPWQSHGKPSDEFQQEQNVGKSMRLMMLPWPVTVATVALHDDYVFQNVGHHRAQWLKVVIDHVHDKIGIRHPMLQEITHRPFLGQVIMPLRNYLASSDNLPPGDRVSKDYTPANFPRDSAELPVPIGKGSSDKNLMPIE